MNEAQRELPPGLPIRCVAPLSEVDLYRLRNHRPIEHRVVETRRVSDGTIVVQEVKSEVFDLDHTDFGPLRFFVRGIKDAIVDRRLDHMVYQATLTREWYEHILHHNGIEESRISTLTGRDLRTLPIAVLTGHADVNFIDGSHRLVYRWRASVPTFRFILIHINDITRLNLLDTRSTT